MTIIKWLIKWFPLVALFVFLMTLFAMNLDQKIQIRYYGLAQPITAQFWELVVFSVAVGIIIVAIGDLFSQMRWLRERRRMTKRDREHQGEVQALNETIQTLEAEKQTLKREIDQKSRELAAQKSKGVALQPPRSVELSGS
jgi:type III secretory pathway component EscU